MPIHRIDRVFVGAGVALVAIIAVASFSQISRKDDISHSTDVAQVTALPDCGIDVPDVSALPEGWRSVRSRSQCLTYAAPSYAERGEVDGADGMFASIVHRGTADDGSDLQSVVVDDGASEFGCHAPPDLYPPDCLDAVAVQERYERMDDARAKDVYLGPEVRGACEGMEAPCVVREAHLFTENGRWLTVLTFMGEAEYDGGGAKDFLDIVRSMDAR